LQLQLQLQFAVCREPGAYATGTSSQSVALSQAPQTCYLKP